VCHAGAEQGSPSRKTLAGMPVLQAAKKISDTQMQPFMAIMSTSNIMGMPEGSITKIHTSRHFGSRGRGHSLAKKKTGKATLAIRTWLTRKKKHCL